MGCSCTKDMKEGQPSRQKKYEMKPEETKEKSKSQQQKEEHSSYNNSPQKQEIVSPVKRDKYERTEEDKQIQEIYLKPERLVELSQTNEKEFILQVKKFKLFNLNRFRGYEAPQPLVLASGRKVMSTQQWNPFTFALVLGKVNLYNFIYKEANQNMKKVFELDRLDQNNHLASEDQDQEGVIEVLTLMIENNSPLLKQVFNDLSHLIKSTHVKRIIPLIMRSPESQKLLDLFINSKTFISVYIQKVKWLSSQKYKGSFEFFFEKYFSKFASDPQLKKELAKAFSNAPFNLGFGSSLILNYRKSK